MNHYISMMKPGRPDLEKSFDHLNPAEREAFVQHVNYLKKGHAEGRILFAGPSVEQNEPHFAIVVLSAKDKADAKAFMDLDPAVSTGLLTSHVTEFQVFLS